jgi:hypothetical protein
VHQWSASLEAFYKRSEERGCPRFELPQVDKFKGGFRFLPKSKPRLEKTNLWRRELISSGGIAPVKSEEPKYSESTQGRSLRKDSKDN